MTNPRKNLPEQIGNWIDVIETIVRIIVFIGSYIYCIVNYGYLLGIGLGWLPSIIVAGAAGFVAGLLFMLLGVLFIGIRRLFGGSP